jgi:hypothetical protein
LGLKYQSLPEWLITPNTVQKYDFSPEKKNLRPDCMIVEITNDDIDGLLRNELLMETPTSPPR